MNNRNQNKPSLSRFLANRSRMVHESCRPVDMPQPDGTVRRVVIRTGGTFRK